ncbi:MAG: spondin domain-containing protein [Isosphaeraceae bacterium]
MRKVLSRMVLRIATAVAAILIASPAPGGDISITVTNDQPAGGFALAPVWFGVQNGSFNAFTPGSAASSQIATLAEYGNTAPLASLFAGNGPETTLTSGGMLPQFLPGQSATTILSVSNPSVDQFLSFAGMVVPSNDFFMGNATPLQIFNSSGSFVGPMTIKVYGFDVWDAQTEQLSTSVALTFIQGETPGSGMQITDGMITPFLSEPNSASFLQSIEGLTTAAGYPISHVFSADDLIATIQISSVPEPSSLLLLGLGLAGVLYGRTRASLRSRARQ